MLLNPLWRPSVNLDVVDRVGARIQQLFGQLVPAPGIRHHVVVLANAGLNLLANVSERTNQVIQPGKIGMNEGDLVK